MLLSVAGRGWLGRWWHRSSFWDEVEGQRAAWLSPTSLGSCQEFRGHGGAASGDTEGESEQEKGAQHGFCGPSAGWRVGAAAGAAEGRQLQVCGHLFGALGGWDSGCSWCYQQDCTGARQPLRSGLGQAGVWEATRVWVKGQ